MKLALFFKLAVGAFAGALLGAALFFAIYGMNYTEGIGFDGPAGSILMLSVTVSSIVGGMIGSWKLKKSHPGLLGLRIMGLFIWIFLAVFIVTSFAASIGIRVYPDGSRHSDKLLQ